MALNDIMQLSLLSKEQLVELCNALYNLLDKQAAPLPAFTFLPAPSVPYYPPPSVPTITLGWAPNLYGFPMGGTTCRGDVKVCIDNPETTQQERFGVR